MGGAGSGRKPEPKQPIGIAPDFFIPNHSGDNSAGKILKTPANDNDIPNKKYVDDGDTYLDNEKLYFGTGDDASITYDGTNLLINPKEVGTGTVRVSGKVEIGTPTTPTANLFIKNSAFSENSIKIENSLIKSCFFLKRI